MKKILLLLCTLLLTVTLSAQQITNVKQKIENGRIIITYDITGSNENYTVLVTAKDSYCNSITPSVIVGDIGEVKPGINKTIYWEPQLEGMNVEGWKVIVNSFKKIKGFVYMKGVTFQMSINNRNVDGKHVHTVTLDDFYIGKYEITQKEWKEVMENNPSHFKGDNLPVENVSWYDAVEFCNKKSFIDGLTPCYSGSGKNIICNFQANGYRLPTEVEWEYSAQGGNKSEGYKYSGNDNIDEVAWYDENSELKSHPVGHKQPNELGIYDMSGNLWEWSNDWYVSEFYSSGSLLNTPGHSSCSFRVHRGGGWNFHSTYCQVAFRGHGNPSHRNNYRGFRLVRIP